MPRTQRAAHEEASSRSGSYGNDAAVLTEVCKTYGAVRALDGFSLRIAQGRITALLGPNGAGKTTLLEILSGIRRPDTGNVEVLGLDPGRHRRELAERLGVQVQEFNLQSTVTVREVLDFFASLHSSPVDVTHLLDRFGLAEKAGARFPRLSGGQKRRLAIAKALVGDPEMVILDEPTSGLDPQGQEFLRTEVRRLRDEGRTVLLSTHDVNDAEELADDVVVVDHGTVVAHGRPAQIVEEQCLGWRIVVDGDVPQPGDAGPRCVIVDQGDRSVLFTRDEADARIVLDGRARPSDSPGRAANLRDAFMVLTGTGLRS